MFVALALFNKLIELRNCYSEATKRNTLAYLWILLLYSRKYVCTCLTYATHGDILAVLDFSTHSILSLILIS